MLPHFVWQDFDDVIEETARLRLPAASRSGSRRISSSAFRALGDFAARGVDVELRIALEPWHVLGEEGAAGGTARYVDSSVERLQVRGHRPDRRAPRAHLQRPRACRCSPPATSASSSPACATAPGSPRRRLHPTIGVHAPLIFDLVDTWMNRSLGGCQYHVAHPGGRSYDTFPVNAYEAEGRRLARFFRIGHTPGRIEARPQSATRTSRSRWTST